MSFLVPEGRTVRVTVMFLFPEMKAAGALTFRKVRRARSACLGYETFAY
jgi:hypothetical protein